VTIVIHVQSTAPGGTDGVNLSWQSPDRLDRGIIRDGQCLKGQLRTRHAGGNLHWLASGSRHRHDHSDSFYIISVTFSRGLSV
jgi:hypothetical protein